MGAPFWFTAIRADSSSFIAGQPAAAKDNGAVSASLANRSFVRPAIVVASLPARQQGSETAACPIQTLGIMSFCSTCGQPKPALVDVRCGRALICIYAESLGAAASCSLGRRLMRRLRPDLARSSPIKPKRLAGGLISSQASRARAAAQICATCRLGRAGAELAALHLATWSSSSAENSSLSAAEIELCKPNESQRQLQQQCCSGRDLALGSLGAARAGEPFRLPGSSKTCKSMKRNAQLLARIRDTASRP